MHGNLCGIFKIKLNQWMGLIVLKHEGTSLQRNASNGRLLLVVCWEKEIGFLS